MGLERMAAMSFPILNTNAMFIPYKIDMKRVSFIVRERRKLTPTQHTRHQSRGDNSEWHSRSGVRGLLTDMNR